MIAAATVRPLCAADIADLVGVLRRAYGSEQNFELRLQSYLRMTKVATFVAELNGKPVGMVVGNDYGPLAYVSQMAVDPAMQRRGIGAQLMRRLLAWVDATPFMATELDATPAGVPLYESCGFVETDRTLVYENATSAVAAEHARAYAPGDRHALFALDAQAFGADRSEVLGLLLGSAPEDVVVAGPDRRIDGYAIAQLRSRWLGPVIATQPEIGGFLIDAARVRLPVNHCISIPASNAGVVKLVTARGYRFVRPLAHMVRGTPSGARHELLFARINLGQG